MPEGPEVRLTAEYINSKAEDLIFSAVQKSAVHKSEDIPFKNFKMHARSRGKELMLMIDCLDNGHTHTIRMSMGMTGHFVWEHSFALHPEKHAHLIFHAKNSSLQLKFVDSRRFGRWKSDVTWTNWRGPDIVSEWPNFRKHVQFEMSENKKWHSVAMLDLILWQNLFNGIGNYLRAEIFDRCQVNPFKTYHEMSPDERLRLFKACSHLQSESYVLGGGQLISWRNPFGQEKVTFNDWIKIYKKGEKIADKQGRTFWYDIKWQETEEYKRYTETKK